MSFEIYPKRYVCILHISLFSQTAQFTSPLTSSAVLASSGALVLRSSLLLDGLESVGDVRLNEREDSCRGVAQGAREWEGKWSVLSTCSVT